MRYRLDADMRKGILDEVRLILKAAMLCACCACFAEARASATLEFFPTRPHGVAVGVATGILECELIVTRLANPTVSTHAVRPHTPSVAPE